VTDRVTGDELERLVREHAALERVATLVARQPPQAEVFAAVTREAAMLLGARMSFLLRVESPTEAGVVAGWARDETPVPVGSRGALDGRGLVGQIMQTGQPVRIEDFDEVGETVAAQMRQVGVRSGVAGPVVLGGRVWGALSAAWSEGVPIPVGAEDRVAAFAELVSYAIDNAETREDLRRLAAEQSALRRVATLVAQGAPPAEVFGAVAAEVAAVLDLPLVEMCRYEPDGTATVIGAVGDHPFQTGTNWTLDGPSLTAEVKHTGRPARVEDYADVPGSMRAAARAAGVHAGVGAPIVVDGKVWGVVSAGGSARVRLLPDAETRLSRFTELIATAVSNVQARQDLRRLADEQSALRRIATLAARGSGARAVFDAVCEETGRLFAAASVNLTHFTADGFNETMAGWSLRGVHVPTGTLLPLEGESINAVVRDTAAPARFDSYEGSTGELAARLRQLGIRSEVGAPVIVDGEVWGALIAGTDQPDPLPPDTEFRLAKFAELIAIDVSNATARAELIDSRARIVQAGFEQRRRVVRDLHDGAQQRLVHAVMTLQLARSEPDAPPELARLLEQAVEHTSAAIDELRELAHGIHPALLTTRGLAAAVESLADRAPVPVRVEIPAQRYPASVESAAYFVAAEALTNVAKYARASTARVAVTHHSDALVIEVEDDGVGGATPSTGSGLSGLRDRLAALQGQLIIDSPPARGTRLRAEIPLVASAVHDASAADSPA
jgi:signal transduction histidine kinase